MPEVTEKRGPIEKGEKGWPINPFGVAALVIFAILVILLIVRPLIDRKLAPKETISAQLTKPAAGLIVKENTLPIALAVDNPSKVAKVQFWVRAYVDNKWEMIGEDTDAPYEIEWKIPESYKNKALVVTSHIYGKDDTITKDPGGWREGIIILTP